MDLTKNVDGYGAPVVFRTKRFATFSELDPFGHVNSETYFRYYMENRFHGTRESLGITMKEWGEWPIIFPLVEINVKYFKALYLDEEFYIESSVTNVGKTSCEVSAQIRSGDKIASQALMTLVCVDKKSGKPTPWPPNTIERYFEK